MNSYKIPCTEEQTKKALNLGVPIKKISHYYNGEEFYSNDKTYLIPTAEEMIGWLEEQDVYINVCWEDCIYYVQIRSVDKGYIGIGDTIYTSRKEATIAAIDVALEYLTNNK